MSQNFEASVIAPVKGKLPNLVVKFGLLSD